METTSTPHIDIHNKGIDPSVAALLSGANAGGFGGANSWLPLLFLLGGRGGFGGFGGGWGGGYGVGPAGAAAIGATAGLAEAQAIASITSAKDAVTATNAAKDFLSSEVASLSKQLCCTEGQLLQAINAITPAMFQQFSQAQLAACQNQAATIAAINHSENFLSSQNERISAAAAMTACQTQNLIRESNCDIKATILSDGEKTRALINANTLDEVRQQLSDCKAKNSNLEQTNALAALINAKCCASTPSGK